MVCRRRFRNSGTLSYRSLAETLATDRAGNCVHLYDACRRRSILLIQAGQQRIAIRMRKMSPGVAKLVVQFVQRAIGLRADGRLLGISGARWLRIVDKDLPAALHRLAII